LSPSAETIAMELTTLPIVVTLILALSIATERFVEIIKGFFPSLSQSQADPVLESHRAAKLQSLAVVGGWVISGLALPITRQIIPSENWLLTVLALGLLASGGSGFWNSILTYVTNLKDLKEADLATRKANPAVLPLPEPRDGVLRP
jgi:hypothetical protein